MVAPRDWGGMKGMSERLLERQTGEGLKVWNERVRTKKLPSETELRDWLATQGVTGYAQSLIVMERFGYPDYLTASAEELIRNQFANRPQLRPV